MASCWRLLALLLSLRLTHAFLSTHPNHVRCSLQLNMVRNIDLPEALVFYGTHCLQHDDGTLLPGVASLIAECKELQTPVLVISTNDNDSITHDDVIVTSGSPPPPNPRALYEAVTSQTIQPRGFGGSSGFGRKAADPERAPEFQYTVVLTDSLQACRAARYVGARVMCTTDNDLADAIVDEWEDLCIDDVATPGSYWLNPPHPRDDDGNRVDVYEIMDYYERKHNDDSSLQTPLPPTAMDGDEMSRILADLDSI